MRQSTSRQVGDLKAFAALNRLCVCNIYEEQISGARPINERRVLCECINRCKNGSTGCILFSEVSRLGRIADEVEKILKRLAELGINAIFQKERIVLLNRDGSLNEKSLKRASTCALAAEIERENISFRLNSGRAKAIADGKKMGRPQGSKNRNELQPQNKYPEVVTLLRNGMSVRKVAARAGISKSTVMKVKTIVNIRNGHINEKR